MMMKNMRGKKNEIGEHEHAQDQCDAIFHLPSYITHNESDMHKYEKRERQEEKLLLNSTHAIISCPFYS
jgi:hypothetical protein